MKRPGKWEEKGVAILGLRRAARRRGCIGAATVNYGTGGIGFVYRRGSMERIAVSVRPDSESMPDVDVPPPGYRQRGPSCGLSRTDCVSSLSSIARISCQSVGKLASRGLPIAITDTPPLPIAINHLCLSD